MTFAELVDETVAYYSNNPRSLVIPNLIGGAACQYAGPNGERCAAARLCDESATDLEAMDSQDQPAWTDVHHMATLKPEYAHFTIEQIFDLQHLHDRDSNWTDPYGKSSAGGLTGLGKKAVYNLKLRYQTIENE